MIGSKCRLVCLHAIAIITACIVHAIAVLIASGIVNRINWKFCEADVINVFVTALISVHNNPRCCGIDH